MRLIDADALIEEVWHSGLGSRQDCVNLIHEMPTIERPHGEWIEKYHERFKYYCSRCGSGTDREGNFCDACGADMREPEDIPMEYFESGGR